MSNLLRKAEKGNTGSGMNLPKHSRKVSHWLGIAKINGSMLRYSLNNLRVRERTSFTQEVKEKGNVLLNKNKENCADLKEIHDLQQFFLYLGLPFCSFCLSEKVMESFN